MTIDDLIASIERGLRHTLDLTQAFSDDPDAVVRPEYLKTIAVAQNLKDKVGDRALIRLEQDTGKMLGASVLPKHRPHGFSTVISRRGEVDIVVQVDENGWKFPVVIIENKLYAGGFSTIKDDVVRCAEFVAAQQQNGSLEVAAVTYFRRETRGIVVDHLRKSGSRALGKIKDCAAKFANHYGVNHRHSHVELVQTGFASRKEALQEDEAGMPAYIGASTYAVWGAVEIFWREQTPSRFARL